MIKTNQAVQASPMNKGEAKALTDRIRTAVDGLGALVEQAHDRQAWKAMGYATWESYVAAEFGFTRQRSYQLLDQARVGKEIASAAGGLSNAFDISARDAAAVKPVLDHVKADVSARVEAGQPPAAAAKEAVEAAREKAKADRAAQKAENERQRDEARAALPDAVKIKPEKPSPGSGAPSLEWLEALDTAKDRVAELEEENRALAKENAVLSARIKIFDEMRVQYEKGGFAEVIAGKDEEIRVLKTRVERESGDKASWKRTADLWRKRAEGSGWSNDVTIDLDTGEIVNA